MPLLIALVCHAEGGAFLGGKYIPTIDLLLMCSLLFPPKLIVILPSPFIREKPMCPVFAVLLLIL